MHNKVRLLNVDVDDVSMRGLIENFRQGVMLTLHVDMIMKLQMDCAFYDPLHKFDDITCDSWSGCIGTPSGLPWKTRCQWPGADATP